MNDPVEILRAAAAKLREMAAAATPGPWKSRGNYEPLPGCRCLSCVKDEPWSYEIDKIDGPDDPDTGCSTPMHINHADAEWIAKMGPDKAEILAQWLEKEAIWLGWLDHLEKQGVRVSRGENTIVTATVGIPGVATIHDTSPMALTLARSILEEK